MDRPLGTDDNQPAAGVPRRSVIAAALASPALVAWSKPEIASAPMQAAAFCTPKCTITDANFNSRLSVSLVTVCIGTTGNTRFARITVSPTGACPCGGATPGLCGISGFVSNGAGGLQATLGAGATGSSPFTPNVTYTGGFPFAVSCRDRTNDVTWKRCTLNFSFTYPNTASCPPTTNIPVTIAAQTNCASFCQTTCPISGGVSPAAAARGTGTILAVQPV